MLAFPAAAGNYAAATETAERLARRVDGQNARLVDALQRGMADGSIRPVDPHQTATALWASWNGIISLAWRPDALRRDEGELQRLLTLAADVVKRGLVTD